MRDLPALLRPGDLLVFNDTRVIPARLLGRRGAAKIEVTLHQPVGGAAAIAGAAEPAGADAATAGPAPCGAPSRGRRGAVASATACAFGADLEAEVLAKGEGGEITLGFGCAPEALLERLESCGHMPLPPYIRRPPEGDAQDRADYQTMFAARAGAVAAPTAALHFTPPPDARARRARHRPHPGHAARRRRHLPAGQGGGHEHAPHARRMVRDAARGCRTDQRRARRAAAASSRSAPRSCARSRPPSRLTARCARARARPACSSRRATAFGAADLLLTNFHLPRSTLFMLVAAFAGLARMQPAYAHAIGAGYRFYSYGDACLLERTEAER